MNPILMNPVFWVIVAWLALAVGAVIYTTIAIFRCDFKMNHPERYKEFYNQNKNNRDSNDWSIH